MSCGEQHRIEDVAVSRGAPHVLLAVPAGNAVEWLSLRRLRRGGGGAAGIGGEDKQRDDAPHPPLRGTLRFFFFSSRRRHTRWPRDWSSDVCSSDLKSRAFVRWR